METILATVHQAPIHVPDIEGPSVSLCYAQHAMSMVRCDRPKGHQGAHSWEITRLVKLLERLDRDDMPETLWDEIQAALKSCHCAH